MKIILDASNHTMYPIGSNGFTSGTVVMVRQIAAGLAKRGHTVHVITPDLEVEDQQGPTLWYWPPSVHPLSADVAVQLMHVNPDAEYNARVLLLITFGIDPFLGPDHSWAQQVDGFPVLSAKHGELLRKARPTVPESKCFVTGLGVDLTPYDELRTILSDIPTPGRMFYSNDPTRGLLPLLDIFDRVKKEVPEATLHIAYDFDGNLERVKWEHSYRAQMLLECKRRIESTPGIVNLGACDCPAVVMEQLDCQVHCMPSSADADQLHGLSQLECAAAGAALVLSDVAAFPEVFGEGATIVPQVGKYIPQLERRITAEDWAPVVIELMKDDEVWQAASQKARALAEKHSWSACIDRWEQMLATLKEGVLVG